MKDDDKYGTPLWLTVFDEVMRLDRWRMQMLPRHRHLERLRSAPSASPLIADFSELELRIAATYLKETKEMVETVELPYIPGGTYALRITGVHTTTPDDRGNYLLWFNSEVIGVVTCINDPLCPQHLESAIETSQFVGRRLCFNYHISYSSFGLQFLIDSCPTLPHGPDGFDKEDFVGCTFVANVAQGVKHEGESSTVIRPLPGVSRNLRKQLNETAVWAMPISEVPAVSHFDKDWGGRSWSGPDDQYQCDEELLRYNALDAMATAAMMPELEATESAEASDSPFCQCNNPQSVPNVFGTVAFYTCECCGKEISGAVAHTHDSLTVEVETAGEDSPWCRCASPDFSPVHISAMVGWVDVCGKCSKEREPT